MWTPIENVKSIDASSYQLVPGPGTGMSLITYPLVAHVGIGRALIGKRSA
jgi:hypothetical protein